MDQLSFGLDMSDEQKAFELVYPQLCDILYNAPIESEILVFKEINNCSSVYFLNTNMVFFQIRLRKKSRYLLISEEYDCNLLKKVNIYRTKSEPGMIRIPLETPEDILQYVPLLRLALKRISKRYHSFACCSRYEACSDARVCVHPDVKFAIGCQYRHNLMDGKIFYGKNRNVD